MSAQTDTIETCNCKGEQKSQPTGPAKSCPPRFSWRPEHGGSPAFPQAWRVGRGSEKSSALSSETARHDCQQTTGNRPGYADRTAYRTTYSRSPQRQGCPPDCQTARRAKCPDARQ